MHRLSYRFSLLVMGIIALGVIGSGMWEILLRPTLSWAARAILALSAFGIPGAKDAIYAEVAKGCHEEHTFFILSYMIGLLFAGCVAVALLVLVPSWRSERFSGQTSEIRGENRRVVIKRPPSRVEYVLGSFIVLAAAFVFVRLLKLDYTNGAVTHFNQCVSICKPHLEDREADLIQSRFSQIMCRQDYLEVIDMLRRTAEKNDTSIPEFDPW